MRQPPPGRCFPDSILLEARATEAPNSWVTIALILAIDYKPWGNAVFGTAPIPLTAWVLKLPFALDLVVLDEARKWLQHHGGGEG